jgi:hypothetical protein
MRAIEKFLTDVNVAELTGRESQVSRLELNEWTEEKTMSEFFESATDDSNAKLVWFSSVGHVHPIPHPARLSASAGIIEVSHLPSAEPFSPAGIIHHGDIAPTDRYDSSHSDQVPRLDEADAGEPSSG